MYFITTELKKKIINFVCLMQYVIAILRVLVLYHVHLQTFPRSPPTSIIIPSIKRNKQINILKSTMLGGIILHFFFFNFGKSCLRAAAEKQMLGFNKE